MARASILSSLVGVGLLAVPLSSSSLLAEESAAAASLSTPASPFPDDERADFGASFFIGSAIDNFAADDVSSYLNPDASGDPGVFERAIGGIQFSYRLFGSEGRGDQQLWIYGLTIHGVRSSDVDCASDSDIKVCKGFEEETDPAGRFLYIVRNASSLEAAVGARWEFARLREGGENSSRAYVSVQLGFLTVQGVGDDVIDQHHLGLGVTATEGRFRDSYLELGYGRSDLFAVNPDHRWKVNALLSWWPDGWNEKVSGFARILVDSDFGDGADSIQSYFGLRFDLGKLFARSEKSAGDDAIN